MISYKEGLKLNNPLNVRTHPWDEIEEFYVDLLNYGLPYKPMLEIIDHIISTDLKDRLFAFTSMHTLVVGIYSTMEFNKEALHLEYFHNHQQWHFRYYTKPHEPVEFDRTYPAEIGLDKFISFIKIVKW